MLKFIIVATIAWLIGVFGWAQIIGSIQNLRVRKNLLYTLILWIVLMALGAYCAIITFNSLWALIVGYAISFIQIISAGKIEIDRETAHFIHTPNQNSPDSKVCANEHTLSERQTSPQTVAAFHVAKRADGSPEIIAPLLDPSNAQMLKGLLRTDSVGVHEVSHFEKDFYLFLFNEKTEPPYSDVMIFKFKRVGEERQYIDMKQEDLKAVAFALDHYL